MTPKNIFNTRDITTPKDGLMVYKNAYWLCVDGEPTKALFYGTSPQCNISKQMVEFTMRGVLYQEMSLSVVFIETAFVPERN